MSFSTNNNRKSMTPLPPSGSSSSDGSTTSDKTASSTNDSVKPAEGITDITGLIAALNNFSIGGQKQRQVQSFDLKNHVLSSEERFDGKNVTDFILRLEDSFETYGVTDDTYRIQALTSNVKNGYLFDIKTLDGYKERNYDLFRESLRKEYIATDDRQRKETAAYLYELAAQSAAKKLDTRGFIKEFKTYLPLVMKAEELTGPAASKIFLGGLPEDVRRQVNLSMNIDPRVRSTFNKVELIIAESERIVIGNENMALFSLDSHKGSALDRIVNRTVSKRNEAMADEKPGLAKPQLRADILECLEALRSTDASRSIAFYAAAESSDPAMVAARKDVKQYALLNEWIYNNFQDTHVVGNSSINQSFIPSSGSGNRHYSPSSSNFVQSSSAPSAQTNNVSSSFQAQPGRSGPTFPPSGNQQTQPNPASFPPAPAPRLNQVSANAQQPPSGNNGPGTQGAPPAEKKPCKSCSGMDHYERFCPDVKELIDQGICFWNMNEKPRWWHWGTAENPGAKIGRIENGKNHGQQIRAQLEQFQSTGGVSSFGSSEGFVRVVEVSDSEDEDFGTQVQAANIGQAGDQNFLPSAYLMAASQPRASSRKAATGKSKGKQPAGISKSTETTAPTVKHTVHGRFQKEAEEHLARQNGQDEVDDSVMDMDSDDEDSTLRNKSPPPPKVRKTKRAPTLKQYITSKDKSEDGVRVAGNILQQSVQLSLQDAIVHVPALRDLLYKSLPAQVAESIRPEMEEMERRRKEKSDERKRKAAERQGLSAITEEVGIMSIQHEKELTSQMAMEIDKDNSRTRVSARSPIVMTRIKNLEIKALCDTGAEVNVMSEAVAKQCGLAINSISQDHWRPVLNKLKVADGRNIPLVGWTTARMRIAGADFDYSDLLFVVLKNSSWGIILGQPFSVMSRLVIKTKADGSISCQAYSLDGERNVVWQAVMAEFPYSKYRSETYNKKHQFDSDSDSNTDDSENEEAES